MLVRLNLLVEEGLRRQLKAKSALEGKSITQVLTFFIKEYIGEENNSNSNHRTTRKRSKR